MTPCKFQLDATGTAILIYSEDRRTVHAMVADPGLIETIKREVGLEGQPSKAYAMAEMSKRTDILIGRRIEDPGW